MNRWWTLPFALLLILLILTAATHAQDDSSSDDDSDSSASTPAATPAVAPVDSTAAAGAPVAVADAPATTTSDTGRPGRQDLITMNFQNVDIPVLANFISEITGKNFVVDENVRGKISIISPTKVTPEQAYSIFQSVLQLKGFTTQQAGPVIKIVPARDVRQTAPITESQQPGLSQGDEYVTRMVRLRNTDAASVMSVIQPMVSHDGLIAAFPQDNTLIITDDAFNVQRLLRIIGALDVHGVQQDVTVIPLRLAFADDVAQQIEKIMTTREAATHGGPPRPGFGVVAPSAQGASVSFAIVPDERTNSLIVLASPIQMRQIRGLISQLDIHAPNETYRIHVIHLKYAPANQMMDTLNGLLGGGGGPSTLSPTTGRNSLGRGSSLGTQNGSAFGSGFGSGGFGSSSSGGLGGAFGTSGSFGGTGIGAGGVGSGVSGGSSGLGSRSGSSSSTTASAGSNGGRGTDFESPVNVTADLATNSLILSAAPQDYETLKRVIDQLDIPRTQVFVQAIIVEVSVDRTKDIGVNFYTSGTLGGNVLGIGTLNTGNLQNALGNPLGITGLGLGLASGSNCSIPSGTSSTTTTTTGTSTSGTLTVPCDLALMTALQSDTHANILSAPTLLTADNEEAMIVVGQNLPFVGSAAATSALSGQIFNSVDRQNVGISLDMVPQVSQGDSIRLDIYEEVSNVVPGTANNTLGPSTTIRSASTSVFVQNHRTAVIGGLISNETDTARSGVPFLSDIPVIGNLFSDNSKDATKDNLIIFLTPHVIRSRDDMAALAIDERQKFVHELGKKEINVMPPSQFQRLYKPTFNAPISPQEDLQQQMQPLAPNGMSLPNAASPSSSAPSTAYPPLSYSYPPSSYPSTSYPAVTYPASSNAARTSATYPPVYRGTVKDAGAGNASSTQTTGTP